MNFMTHDMAAPHLLVKAGGHLSSCCSNFIGRWLGHDDARPGQRALTRCLARAKQSAIHEVLGWFKGQFIDVMGKPWI